MEVTMYKCPYCGYLYETQSECDECESKHFDIETIEEAKYNTTDRYPYFVKIKMSSGLEVGYKRV